MASQEFLPPVGRQPSIEESLPGPSFMLSPSRRDTVSTVSSEKGRSFPVDVWTLSIHGNCSRCHHHHKAAVVQIKVPDGLGEAHDLRCENCNKRWLTIGRRNTTQLSLLSTRTMTLDSEEEELRCTLINIVRSAMPATAIAFPPLASVPESSSRVPSRGNSVRAHDQDTIQSVVDSRPDRESSPINHTARNSLKGNANKQRTTPKAALANKARLTKKTLADIKRKLEDTFPILKKVRFRKRQHKRTAKAEGKLPVIEYPRTQDASPTTDEEPDKTEQSRNNIEHKPTPNARDICTSSKMLSEALEDVRKFDREEISRMNADERAAWVREKSADWIRGHITNFKCRCARHCSCRNNHSTSSLMFDGTRVFSNDEARRHLLEGLGSHFNDFPPGALFTGPFTVGTRTSEADTAVDGHTITSSPRNSRLDVAQRSRHRSWSPRPASLVTSRHSLHLRHDLVQRDSMDSIITGAGVRSPSRGGRRAADRRSMASLAPPPILSRPDSPEVPSHTDRPTPDENDSTRTPRPRSAASTPQFNGYLTDDERNRESDATPPADASHA